MIRLFSLSIIQQLFFLGLLGLSLCSFQQPQNQTSLSKKLALAQKSRNLDNLVNCQKELVTLLAKTEDETVVWDAGKRFLSNVFNWESVDWETKASLLGQTALPDAWHYAFQVQLHVEQQEQDSSYFYLSLLESLTDNTMALGYTYGTFARVFAEKSANYKDAYHYLQKAENLLKTEGLVLLQRNQAAVYQALGYFSKAKTAVLGQIEHLKKQLYVDSIGLADCYYRLATIYWEEGDFINAQNYSGDAINYLADRIGVEKLMQKIWAIFARSAYRSQKVGREGTVLYLRKALSLVPEMNSATYIELCALLAEAFAKVDMLDSANIYLDKAQKITKTTKIYLEKVAQAEYVLFKQERATNQAFAAIQRAWQYAENTYGTYHWITAEYAFTYGQALLEAKRYKIAYEVLKKAFLSSIVTKQKHLEWSPNAFWSKEMSVEILVAQVNAMLGLYDKSKYNISLRSIYEMAEFNIQLLKSIRYKTAGTLALAVPVYEQMIEVCLLLNERQPKATHLTTAFEVAEEFKQLFLNETLKEPLAQTYGAIDPQLIKEEYHWQQQLECLESSALKVYDDLKQREWYQEQIAKAKAQLQLVANGLKKNYPRYYQQYYTKSTPSIDSLQQYLGDSTILVQYMEGETSIYQFLITQDTFVVRKIFWRTYKNILLKYYKHFTEYKMVQHAQSGSRV